LQEWLNIGEQSKKLFFNVEIGIMGGINRLENVLSLMNIKINLPNQTF